LKEKGSGNKKLNAEVENIKKILPDIESFEMFKQTTEVLDLVKETVIKKRSKLFDIYEKGTPQKVFIFVFNKN
jgi:hypothetical protein